MIIHTIGFTQKTAQEFFELLRRSGASRLVDVRLNNVSQLAGFSKRDDLRYFLRTILGMDYVHLPLLAPTQEILDEYKKNKGDWAVYQTAFLSLMAERRVETVVEPRLLDGACLLCSEHKPEHCHRRLVADYIAQRWENVRVIHLY
jgi:uncharacterized protein (DUF488 family)